MSSSMNSYHNALTTNDWHLAISHFIALSSSFFLEGSNPSLFPSSIGYLTATVAQQIFISRLPEAGLNSLSKTLTNPLMLTGSYALRSITQRNELEVLVSGTSSLVITANAVKRIARCLSNFKRQPILALGSIAVLGFNTFANIFVTSRVLLDYTFVPLLPVQALPYIGAGISQETLANLSALVLVTGSQISVTLSEPFEATYYSFFPKQLETRASKTIKERQDKLELILQNRENEINECRLDLENYFQLFPKEPPQDLKERLETRKCDLVPQGDDRFIGNKKDIPFTNCCFEMEKDYKKWLNQDFFSQKNELSILKNFYGKIQKELEKDPKKRIFEQIRQSIENLKTPLILNPEKIKSLTLSEEAIEEYAEKTLLWWKEVFSRWEKMEEKLSPSYHSDRRNFEKWFLRGSSQRDPHQREITIFPNANLEGTSMLSDPYHYRSLEKAEIPSVETLYSWWNSLYQDWKVFQEKKANYPRLEVWQFEQENSPKHSISSIEDQTTDLSDRLFNEWKTQYDVWKRERLKRNGSTLSLEETVQNLLKAHNENLAH